MSPSDNFPNGKTKTNTHKTHTNMDYKTKQTLNRLWSEKDRAHQMVNDANFYYRRAVKHHTRCEQMKASEVTMREAEKMIHDSMESLRSAYKALDSIDEMFGKILNGEPLIDKPTV